MTDLTFGDVSVLDTALQAFRKTGDRRRSEEEYDALAAKLAALGNEALARETADEAGLSGPIVALDEIAEIRRELDMSGVTYSATLDARLACIELALRGGQR